MWWILSILLAGLHVLAYAGDLPIMKIGEYSKSPFPVASRMKRPHFQRGRILLEFRDIRVFLSKSIASNRRSCNSHRRELGIATSDERIPTTPDSVRVRLPLREWWELRARRRGHSFTDVGRALN